MHPLILAAMVFAGPLPPAAGEGQVTLLVSRGFGNPPLVERAVPCRDRSVLDILAGAAAVETAFGGAFVERIHGIPGNNEPGAGRAWVYYVNGMLAEVGAKAYIPSPGDVVWWDFHPWEGVSQVRALVGCFPQPFLGASRRNSPPRIVFSDSVKEEAAALEEALARQAIRGARLQPLSSPEIPEGAPAIVLGPWDEIVRVPAVRAAVSAGGRCGLFVDRGGEGMRILDLAGKPRASYPKAGAIIAVGGGASRPTPLWLVTGTDAEAARRAADLLISRPGKIRGMASAVIAGDTIHPAPAID